MKCSEYKDHQIHCQYNPGGGEAAVTIWYGPQRHSSQEKQKGQNVYHVPRVIQVGEQVQAEMAELIICGL